jgi:hypothetical protein
LLYRIVNWRLKQMHIAPKNLLIFSSHFSHIQFCLGLVFVFHTAFHCMFQPHVAFKESAELLLRTVYPSVILYFNFPSVSV